MKVKLEKSVKMQCLENLG